MPINLQNHRTSNAKLFSSGTTSKKLHTATSLMKQRNIRVSRNASGDGSRLGFLSRSSDRTTTGDKDKPRRQRRHSMGGSLEAAAASAGLVLDDHHDLGSASEYARPRSRHSTSSAMRRTSSLDTSLLPTPATTTASKHSSESRTTPSSSRGDVTIPTATPPPGEQRRRSSSSSKKKSSMRRSSSMGTEATRSNMQVAGNDKSGHSLNASNSSQKEDRDSLKATRNKMRRSKSSASGLPAPLIQKLRVLAMSDDSNGGARQD